MEEYRDVHTNHNVDRYFEQINSSSMSDRQKKLIEKFVSDMRIGKAGKKVRARRIGSYLQFLVYLHNTIKKDFDKLTEKEAEDFYRNLYEDKIKRNNGMPYSVATKDMFVRTLKRYLGWRMDNKTPKYKKLVGWMKEDYKKSDKKAIEFSDVEKCVEGEKYLRNRCLFMFLFDSGARIEEALNVKLKDITLSKAKGKRGNYYIVHLRGTKTEDADRNVSIPLTKKLLKEWLEEHPTKEENDFLFPINYDNARKIIREMSKKALGFSLTPHEMRHSSATYYIQHFGTENVGGFYYRFGWKFGSKQALIYIKQHMLGGEVGQDKVVKTVESGRLEELEEKVEEMNKKIEATTRVLNKVIPIMKNSLNIIEVLKANERRRNVPARIYPQTRE